MRIYQKILIFSTIMQFIKVSSSVQNILITQNINDPKKINLFIIDDPNENIIIQANLFIESNKKNEVTMIYYLTAYNHDGTLIAFAHQTYKLENNSQFFIDNINENFIKQLTQKVDTSNSSFIETAKKKLNENKNIIKDKIHYLFHISIQHSNNAATIQNPLLNDLSRIKNIQQFTFNDSLITKQMWYNASTKNENQIVMSYSAIAYEINDPNTPIAFVCEDFNIDKNNFQTPSIEKPNEQFIDQLKLYKNNKYKDDLEIIQKTLNTNFKIQKQNPTKSLHRLDQHLTQHEFRKIPKELNKIKRKKIIIPIQTVLKIQNLLNTKDLIPNKLKEQIRQCLQEILNSNDKNSREDGDNGDNGDNNGKPQPPITNPCPVTTTNTQNQNKIRYQAAALNKNKEGGNYKLILLSGVTLIVIATIIYSLLQQPSEDQK